METSCEECGSHDVRRERLYGLLVEVCGLCGGLQGDPDAVARVGEIREAEELGVAPELIGLFAALESAGGFAVDRALSTAAGHSAAPSIYFTVARPALEWLDRLAKSLLLAGRRTSTLWGIEVVHQGRLRFVLRPRLAGTPATWAADLALLRDALRRDSQLDWWRVPPRGAGG
jgi:hypothetical protein